MDGKKWLRCEKHKVDYLSCDDCPKCLAEAEKDLSEFVDKVKETIRVRLLVVNSDPLIYSAVKLAYDTNASFRSIWDKGVALLHDKSQFEQEVSEK